MVNLSGKQERHISLEITQSENRLKDALTTVTAKESRQLGSMVLDFGREIGSNMSREISFIKKIASVGLILTVLLAIAVIVLLCR